MRLLGPFSPNQPMNLQSNKQAGAESRAQDQRAPMHCRLLCPTRLKQVLPLLIGLVSWLRFARQSLRLELVGAERCVLPQTRVELSSILAWKPAQLHTKIYIHRLSCKMWIGGFSKASLWLPLRHPRSPTLCNK